MKNYRNLLLMLVCDIFSGKTPSNDINIKHYTTNSDTYYEKYRLSVKCQNGINRKMYVEKTCVELGGGKLDKVYKVSFAKNDTYKIKLVVNLDSTNPNRANSICLSLFDIEVLEQQTLDLINDKLSDISTKIDAGIHFLNVGNITVDYQQIPSYQIGQDTCTCFYLSENVTLSKMEIGENSMYLGLTALTKQVIDEFESWI